MQFYKRLHKKATDKFVLHNILWRDEACSTREGVFNARNRRTWALDNPQAIRERGYDVCFSVNVSAAIVAGTAMGPICHLNGKLLNDIVIFWTLFYRAA
jgi:hypothetical protein